MNFDLEKTVRLRKSVRTYENRPLAKTDKDKVNACILEILAEDEPFPADISIRLLEAVPGTDTEKLGTYGVIRGAKDFLCVTVKDTESAMEAVGYRFEKLVLYATAMGLGTCWLAGTFNREQFSDALRLETDDIFPIVCPIGYPLQKQTLISSVFRKVGKSDQRKEWSELFFENEFGSPLTTEAAGEYAFPLEMMRLAPSAANRQPWRIVHKDGVFHFYREENPKSKYPYDLQRLDVGIGACHFHLAAGERALAGTFTKLSDTGIDAPSDVKYLFSWLAG
ncbi:MAG: nitroreductase family protein [Lachnospiraceae bacterium]|nr:nitroreductase family protein [Lachnospiraceae bacterium]